MIAALFSVLLFASDTSAAAAQPQQGSTGTTEAPQEEKKICKREMATESRMGSKRICLTAAEWRERQSRGDGNLGLINK